MKKMLRITLLSLPALFSLLSSCAQAGNKDKATPVSVEALLKTEEKYYAGSSIKIPAGWKILQAGNCSDLSFISWDPAQPGKQIFFYGMAPMFYLSAQQKQVDNNYVRMGGMRTPLIGQPVIAPLTPENFIRNFYLFTEMPQAQTAQKLPELYNVEIISVVPQPSHMPGFPATAAMVRALFTDKHKQSLSEGLFLVTVLPFKIAEYGPGANLGLAFSFTGITAPFNQLEPLLPSLNNCLQSFTLDQSYVNNCIQASNEFTKGALKAGRTLSESSSTLTKTWENRSRVDDIASQKRSDAMMGRQRLYDPQTKTVYEVDNTFTDKYRTAPEKYNYKNLQQLPPDDATLWKKPMVNGADHIKRVN
jgi:hypothetical protein